MAGRAMYAVGGALRETGQALDRLGSRLLGKYGFREELNRHRAVLGLFEKKPVIGSGAFVAPTAAVVGDVRVGEQASIFYGSVIKADTGSISIGARSNVQDGSTIRTAAAGLHEPEAANTVIGADVTIGHAASLHGCTVEDEALIGMGATLQHGVVVQKGAMVAAGAVVEHGTVVPSGEIWGGSPAKFLRKLKPEEASFLKESADSYVRLSAEHLKEVSA